MMRNIKISARLLHYHQFMLLCIVFISFLAGAQQSSPDFINEIDSIDFRRGEQGEAKVLVFLQHNSAAVDIVEKNGHIQLDFHDTKISDELLYQLDVLDFATVVKTIKAHIYIVSVDTDYFFIPEENKSTFELAKTVNKNVSYHEITSIHGHDAFLIEYQQLAQILAPIFNPQKQQNYVRA